MSTLHTLRALRFFRHAFSTLAILAVFVGAYAQEKIPALTSMVTDLTQTLSANQIQSLTTELSAFEKRKGSQIVVLLVPTTQPEAIEQYSIRVAEAWKIGRKGTDDGAILIIATNDRTIRIEVGYGLEGILTDYATKRIIEEQIVPAFKQGQLFAGIVAGVTTLERLVDGEELPPPKPRSHSGIPKGKGLEILLPILFFGTIFLRSLFGRLFGGICAGGLVGFMIFLVFSSMLGAVALGIIAFIFILLGGMDSRVGGAGPRGGGFFGGGGMGSGGGFSGFSGGGGGFGGGGASGRW